MALRTNSRSPSTVTRVPLSGFVFTLLAALFAFSLSANARIFGPGSKPGVAPLFADNSMMTVTIEAPLTTLMRDRPDEEYLDGKFSFLSNDGTEQTVDLRIRTRGEYRRQKKHCDFAPIRLRFQPEQVEGTVLAGQEKLKVVTHCRTRKKREYDQLLLREYLAYRILNVLTEKSFRVRLLQIHYIDTEGAEPLTRLAFVIEDDDAVAARNGMVAIKTGDISSDDLDRKQQNLVHVFQYMIGHTEYSLFIAEPGDSCCHNIDLMAADAGPPFTPIAYDFDFAGLVNAAYAEPNPRYRLQTVRQRLYKGRCKNNELLPDTIQRFIDGKDAIFRLTEEVELLSVRSKRDVIRYLNSFYRQISKPKTVNKRFVRKCKEAPEPRRSE